MVRPRRLVGILAVAGVAAGGAGAWCCGGGGSVPPESPGGEAAQPNGDAGEVTAALVDPAVVGADPEPYPSSAAAMERAATACPSGPVLLRVRFVALEGGGAGQKIELQTSGAFTDETQHRVAHGCLDEAARTKVEAALARADFTPPPPPEMQCMAVPTREVTVEHPASGRRAVASSPCGKPVHPTIAELIKLVTGLVSTAETDASP